MGHDDFSTNEYFAAAVAQAQGDIPGVTSMQGTRVEPLERETDANGEKSETNAELHKSFKELNKKAKNLSKDMDESIARFEALLAKARGEDTQATEEEAASINAMLSKQQVDAWANLLSQEQGLLNQEDTVATKAEVEAFKKQQKEYMDNLAQETRRASVSPSMSRTRMPDPRGIGGDVGAYIEQQQMGMGPPLGGGNMPTYSGTPTFVEDESAWGAGEYLGAPTFVEDESAWGAGRYQPTINIEDRPLGQINVPSPRTDVPLNTLEQWKDWVENPVNVGMEGLSGSYDYVDVPKVVTKKTTKKTNYGKWNGLINDETPEENEKRLDQHSQAWKDDFESEWGPMDWWGLTRPVVNGEQLTHKQMRLRNEITNTNKFRQVYARTIGVNRALKFGANIASPSPFLGILGEGTQKFVNRKGLGNADTFAETLKKMEEGEYQHEGEGQPTHPKEDVSGGFWGLMAFAKKYPKIFGPLSGDELWALVSDPDGFWEFYEAALSGA